MVTNVPRTTIASGLPHKADLRIPPSAREIRKRFNDAIIDTLLGVKWWDWDMHRIEKALPLFLSSEIDVFLHAVDKYEILWHQYVPHA